MTISWGSTVRAASSPSGNANGSRWSSLRYLPLPLSHGFQVIVEPTEILTRVIDGLELHSFKERGAVSFLVVAPFLNSQEEFVQTF